jgi:hypothetical protein
MAAMRLADALIAVVVTLLASDAPVYAETFPTRPITMMVGFPPGGPTDTLARIIADAMQGSLGQPVVVETLSGASGTIATGRVVHARPDGYTIGIGQWTSHVASPAIYPLDYDILRQGGFAAQDHAGADYLDQSKAAADDLRHGWHRQRRPSLRRLSRAESRTEFAICSVPRRRPGDARPDRRAD